MKNSDEIIERAALEKARLRSDKEDNFLQELAVHEIKERLKFIKKNFEKILVVCGNPYYWRQTFHGADFIDDDEILKVPQKSYDLVIHGMSLHHSNDPVGQLIQCRSAMKKGGLLLGIFLGGQTLNELRESIVSAEIELTGGISPRILPMIDIRDAGSFLMRADFALPVADISVTEINYDKPLDLLYDLRKMGETNVQKHRLKKFSHRGLFSVTSDKYIENQNSRNKSVKATFEFITITGWVPSKDTPKPLKRGSATTRLADALKVKEEKLKD
jgi:SAM-dependent methyltransferase